MTRIEVGSVDDFDDGDRQLIDIDGLEVGVFRLDGEFYALENDCCHLHGPVCEGKVQGKLVAEYRGPDEGVAERFANEPVIACPWHGWEYELATGEHVGDDDIVLPTFDVAVEDGTVVVDLDRA